LLQCALPAQLPFLTWAQPPPPLLLQLMWGLLLLLLLLLLLSRWDWYSACAQPC
jgi:hypothetical protein